MLCCSSSQSTGYSSGDSRHLAVRRHTVGPGDSAHEQVLEKRAMLPYFGGKDPHLLKPPTVLSVGAFGRRASDGGANLHMSWSASPGSHEQLSLMSASSSGNPSSLSSGTQPLDELAAARYLQGRGHAKRHTMANPEDVGGAAAASRTRRSGLLTVMERPPGTFRLCLV